MRNSRSKKPEAIVYFNPQIPKLTKNQLQVLDLLIDAAELIAPIYLQQENHKYPGANFYPHNVTHQEIEKASLKNPQLLSPYTVVEKVDGKFLAVPYHKKYSDLLVPVVEKLLEAAQITDDKEFAKCLKKQAKALQDGSYDAAMVSWMKMKPYILDINIGPVERYDDKLFFVKTAYQAWVGVMDEAETRRFNSYKDIILSARRKVLMPSEKVDYYDKVLGRVDDLVILSGLISRTMFVGVNLPNDPSLMEKYGSEVTLFRQTNQARHKTNLALFNKIFSPSFIALFTEAELEAGSLYSTALHELAHTYLRYRGSETRLKDLFPVIDELGATVMGIKVCGALLLKDIATTKQLESIMLAYMCRSFHNVLNEKDNRSKLHYTLGGAIFINYLLESGALVKSGGVSWPNFTKMFFAVGELAAVLERLLSMGNREDAQRFIKKYGNIEKIQKFK